MNLDTSARFHVLWITTWFPYPENPVAGTFVNEHAQAVTRFDDVTLIHLLVRQQTLHHLWEFEEIHTGFDQGLSGIRVLSKQGAIPWTTLPIQILAALAAVRKFQLKSKNFDLVHAHTYRAGVPAALIAKWFQVPLIITEHSSIFPRHKLQGFEYAKAAFAFRSAQSVLPVSQYLQRAIEQRGFKPRFHIIGNTFNPDIFYPPAHSPKHSKLEIVFVNNLIPIKGLALAIQALANVSYMLPEWTMKVIGSGPERALLEELVNRLGLFQQICFLGTLTKTEIAEYLRRADFFLLSSFYETFSAATMEALACGVPVLATACGGPEDYITPQMGLLIEPGSVPALEKGLLQIVTALGNYNHQQIALEIQNRYGYKAIGEQIHAVYASQLSRE